MVTIYYDLSKRRSQPIPVPVFPQAARQARLHKFTPLQSEFEQGPSNAKNAKKQKSKKGTNKKASQRATKKKIPQVANDLSDKLYQIMEKHKEVRRFFLLFFLKKTL